MSVILVDSDSSLVGSLDALFWLDFSMGSHAAGN